MYFDRSRLLILFLLIWLGALVEVASAQHKYIFPQFAFGAGWESTLMVQARATLTTCTFSAQGRFFTMRDPSGNNVSGTSITLPFGMNGWTILKTATPQGMAVSSGMAVLDCSEEVSTNTLFSLEFGGSLFAEAVVKSAEEIVSGESVAQFLADHRDGARFGLALANPSNQPIEVSVSVADVNGQPIENTTVNLLANDSQADFLDELVTIPTGHTGQVVMGATGSLYVIGLRFTGQVFTTIPATVSHLTTATPPPTNPNPVPGSRADMERILGTWVFTYTIRGAVTRTITKTFRFGTVTELASSSGEWAALATDCTQRCVLAATLLYSGSGRYSVREAGGIYGSGIYSFNFTSADTVNGSYLDRSLNRSYSMTGRRTGGL